MKQLKWPDGTPKSQGNAFCVIYKPSVMAKDLSHVKVANANAKKKLTEKSRSNIFLVGSRHG